MNEFISMCFPGRSSVLDRRKICPKQFYPPHFDLRSKLFKIREANKAEIEKNYDNIFLRKRANFPPSSHYESGRIEVHNKSPGEICYASVIFTRHFPTRSTTFRSPKICHFAKKNLKSILEFRSLITHFC